ncbi:hypothetical protein E8E12_010886 [Didymella heteroderae]|uniref:Uncharacterized protein n=1 Tax=Didymella heteroderae TaxID=1769908 RepID=A0A9P4WYH3_9PLEO|nr:hypothetical protein E8E12_010886 [Didymella heteroderae]
MMSVATNPVGHVTGNADSTHLWSPPNNANMPFPAPLGNHSRIEGAGQTPPTWHDTPNELQPASRAGYKTPQPMSEFDPCRSDETDESRRDFLKYPLFRLVAMGEDTPNNIELFLGPRWACYIAKVMPIYKGVRISILMSSLTDREAARKDFQNWDELTEGLPRE